MPTSAAHWTVARRSCFCSADFDPCFAAMDERNLMLREKIPDSSDDAGVWRCKDNLLL